MPSSTAAAADPLPSGGGLTTVADLLRWSLHRHAGRPAVRVAGFDHTYADLDGRAARLSGHLARLGVRPGDRVATVLLNGVAHFDVQLAAARSGVVTVPIGAYFDPSPDEIAYQLQIAEPAVVVFSSQLAATLAAVRRRIGGVRAWLASDGAGDAYEAALSNGAPEAADYETPAPGAPYCVRFTGGTTGRPKAVLHTQAGYAAMIVNQLLALDVRSNDVMALVHPLSHACGQMMYPYLVRGAQLIVEERFEARRVVQLVREERVTSMFLVPTAIDALLEAAGQGRFGHSSLRTIFYGGAPMSPARLRKALATFGRIFVQVYGQSETPQAVVVLEKSEHRLSGRRSVVRRLASAGRPIPTVGLEVVDPGGRPLPAGAVGEIAVTGPQMMAGYWRDPDATAAKMRNGWVLTGDMAWRDEGGYLFLVDRKDDLIITGGMNVYPREVEDCLLDHPAVGEVAVIGVPDERWGEAVTAVVVLKIGSQAQAHELVEHCRGRLSKYKVPKLVILSDVPLPKSRVGKVLRREVRAPFWLGLGRRVN